MIHNVMLCLFPEKAKALIVFALIAGESESRPYQRGDGSDLRRGWEDAGQRHGQGVACGVHGQFLLIIDYTVLAPCQQHVCTSSSESVECCNLLVAKLKAHTMPTHMYYVSVTFVAIQLHFQSIFPHTAFLQALSPCIENHRLHFDSRRRTE